ncbi:MAG: DUF4402 domain-containing protein [Acidiferrobacteraceae bacterium]|jgi:hypothetical protein
MAMNKNRCRIGWSSALGLALALVAVDGFAATGTALVRADVLTTTSVSASVALNFGELTAGPDAATVVLGPDGSRTSTGGANINSASISSPATFHLVGTPNANFTVSLPLAVTLTDRNGNTMVVNQFLSQPSGASVLDATGERVLAIGGTLNVAPNQVFGSYSGMMDVTITYY